MVEHAHREPHHADVAHEASDFNFRAVVTFGGGLLVLGAVVYFVVWLFFGYLTRRADRASADLAYPLAVGQDDRLPPEPRLQANPRQDLKDLREAEEARLKSYGWVDRDAGVVRIPIDEAMKLTLQRGLPARQATEQQVVK
jgi:hypothetical protein